MNNKLHLYLFLFSLIFCVNGTALAYCSDPSPPYSKPTKPSAPYCVNEYNNTHTCDDWQINSYNSELENYRNDVNRYIRELQSYVEDASDYAQCEINNLE